MGVHSFNISQIRLNRVELEQFYCFSCLYFFVFHVFIDVLPTSSYFRLKIRIPREILRRIVYRMIFFMVWALSYDPFSLILGLDPFSLILGLNPFSLIHSLYQFHGLAPLAARRARSARNPRSHGGTMRQ